MRNNEPMQRWVVVACLATIVYSAGIGLNRFLGSEGEPGEPTHLGVAGRALRRCCSGGSASP